MEGLDSFGKLNYVDVIIDNKKAVLPATNTDKLINRYNEILNTFELFYDNRDGLIKHFNNKPLNLKLRTYEGDNTGFTLTQDDVNKANVLLVKGSKDTHTYTYYFIELGKTGLPINNDRISENGLKNCQCGITPKELKEILNKL